MEKSQKILIYSTYPLPYRTEITKAIAGQYAADIFFETARGDDRNERYFETEGFLLLDTPQGSARFAECKKRLKEYRLVLLMEFSTKTAVRLILQCKRKKVPYAINCDGVMLFRHGNFLKELIKRSLIRKASACLAGGAHAERYFLRYGAKKESIRRHPFTSLYQKDVLPAPPTAARKAELRRKLALPQNAKLCIAVGRFIPLKRYDVLLRLWREMPPEYHLLLLGGGPELADYQSILAEGNNKNVTLEEFHPFAELMEYYQAADLFVHPTSYDVWGLVINEAMANGLPVVVTDTCVAGCELIRNGENGFLTHLGEDAAFVARIREILEDDAGRASMSAAALETIRPYTVENMVASQMKTIGEVVS